MAMNVKEILTVSALADELEITLEEAKSLMQRASFPATKVAKGAFVVTRAALTQWITEHARCYDPTGISSCFFGDDDEPFGSSDHDKADSPVKKRKARVSKSTRTIRTPEELAECFQDDENPAQSV